MNNVLNRKMFVKGYANGTPNTTISNDFNYYDSNIELPLNVIIRERKKRNLPIGFDHPETRKQIEQLQQGMSVAQIFGDNRMENPVYEPLISSKIDRNLPANQIQAELAEVGLDVPLYQIQELAGKNIPQTTNVADFSDDIASVSGESSGFLDRFIPTSKDTSYTPPATKTDIGSNRIMVKGNVYELPSNFKELLDKGILDGMQLFPILNMAYSSDPTTTISEDVDNILVPWAKGNEPLGSLETPNDEFRRERLGYGKEGFLRAPEDFGSFAQVTGYGLEGMGKKALKNIIRMYKGLEGATEVDKFLKDPKVFGIDLDESFNMQDLAEFQVQNIPGIKLVGKADRDEITEGIKDITTEYQPEADETVVTAKRLSPPITPDFDVNKPVDPTKITKEEAEALNVEDPGKIDENGNDVPTNGSAEAGGEATETTTGTTTETTTGTTTTVPTTTSTPLPKGMDMGASLADMFQKISAVPNVKNTLDLLQGGAQTLSALNLAEEAKEKEDTRAYQTAIAKEVAKAKADLNKPLTVREENTLTTRSLEVDQAVTDFKNTSQNLALIDQLIEISKDPNIKGWRGFIGKLTDQTSAFLAAGGVEKTFDQLSPRVQFEKLMTIVSQKNIKDILNETGKTISNIDRDIVDRIMGKITIFTNPAETLKALQLAREDSLKNMESYRNTARTLLGFLKGYGKVPGSAQTERGILEQLINFDRKSYRSNLANQNFTTGSGVSYAGAPVYNLSGQKISD